MSVSRREWLGVLYGLAVLALLIGADVAIGATTVLIASFALAPFVTAAFGGRVGTVLVATLAALAALISRAWDVEIADAEYLIQLGLVIVGGLLALFAAQSRHQARQGTERLQVLNEIAIVAGRSLSIEEALKSIEAVVVPRVADFYMIDRVFPGPDGVTEIERTSVAVGEPRTQELVPQLLARRSSVPAEMIAEIGLADPDYTVRLITPVTDARLRAIAQSPQDLEFLRGLEMNSYVHVALRSRGQLLGVITMAVAWSGRRFTEQDADFAQVLSGRIALALDNAGLFSDLRRIESRLETAMAVLDEAVIIHEREAGLVFANPAAGRLLGVDDLTDLGSYDADAVKRWCRIYDESGMPVEYDELRVMRAQAGEDQAPEIVRVVFRTDRREVWIRPRVRTVLDGEGRPAMAVTALEDITELKRAEFEQTLLGRTADLLSVAKGREAILRLIAELITPKLADCCAVDIIDPDGSWRRAAFVHRDRAHVDRDLLSSGSAIKLELVAGGKRAGVVTFANQGDHRELTVADRNLAQKVVNRAGLALENARLAAARAEIAASLQQGLIPPPLPEIPGWEVAALYRPAGEQNEVGGDFYEAFRIESGWLIVIGDVTGRGARAASVTAQARYTLRTAGSLSRNPAEALGALNRALVARNDNPLCTAAAVELRDGSREALIFAAGHPPVLLAGPDGVQEVGETGPLLGAFDSGTWRPERIEIGPDQRLVLHTDGVTESANEQGRFGERRLRDCLAGPGMATELLARIEGRLTHFVEGDLRDDVAVITIGPEPELDLAQSEHTDLIRRVYDAFNRRALDEIAALATPDVALTVPTGKQAGRGGPYTGFDGLVQYADDLERVWDDLLITPSAIRDVGAKVLVTGRVYARSRSAGMKDMPVAWLWQVRDGLIESGTAFTDVNLALSFAEQPAG